MCSPLTTPTIEATRFDSQQGVTVELPAGFEGRAIRRSPIHRTTAAPPGRAVRCPSMPEKARVATPRRSPPPEVGDFGSNVVDILGNDDVFVAVFEYDRGCEHRPVLPTGIPTSLDEAFSPTLLQRSIKGQSGAQRFFTEADRVLPVRCSAPTPPNGPRGNCSSWQYPYRAARHRRRTCRVQPPNTTQRCRSASPMAAARLICRPSRAPEFTGRGAAGGTGPFTVFAPSDPVRGDRSRSAARGPRRLRRTLEYRRDDLHVDGLEARNSANACWASVDRRSGAVTVDGHARTPRSRREQRRGASSIMCRATAMSGAAASRVSRRAAERGRAARRRQERKSMTVRRPLLDRAAARRRVEGRFETAGARASLPSAQCSCAVGIAGLSSRLARCNRMVVSRARRRALCGRAIRDRALRASTNL